MPVGFLGNKYAIEFCCSAPDALHPYRVARTNRLTRMRTKTVTLHNTLRMVLSTTPDREAVNTLVQLCTNIGLSFLRFQTHRGALENYRFGIPTEDLALDCIADTFDRDEKGHFITLQHYFESLNWQQLSEQELSVALRRLIFSKVNEGLFRSYRAEDPNLAKIIRNIKEAIKRNTRFSLHREREVQWIVVGEQATPDTRKPLVPRDILETYLTALLCDTSNTYSAVYAFEEFLKLHPYYRNAFPLSEYARVLRSCFKNREIPEVTTQELNVSLMDMESALKKTINHVRAKLHETYVRKGKLSRSMFETYVHAIQKILASHFGSPSESVTSQYDALATLIPGLSRDSFQNEHRNVMQYLFKVSRKQMIGYLHDPV